MVLVILASLSLILPQIASAGCPCFKKEGCAPNNQCGPTGGGGGGGGGYPTIIEECRTQLSTVLPNTVNGQPVTYSSAEVASKQGLIYPVGGLPTSGYTTVTANVDITMYYIGSNSAGLTAAGWTNATTSGYNKQYVWPVRNVSSRVVTTTTQDSSGHTTIKYSYYIDPSQNYPFAPLAPFPDGEYRVTWHFNTTASPGVFAGTGQVCGSTHRFNVATPPPPPPPAPAPYTRVYGGDAAAGIGFGSSCSTDANAGIKGYTNASNGGAGVQIGAFASGAVDRFTSAQRSTDPRPPTGLTFSNSSCVPDYYSKRPASFDVNATGNTTITAITLGQNPNPGQFRTFHVGPGPFNPNPRATITLNATEFEHV